MTGPDDRRTDRDVQPEPDWDPHRTTLASYQHGVDQYIAGLSPVPAAPSAEALDRFAGLLPVGGRVLEVGSGPGRDAAVLESRGLSVRRTDATAAFVDRLRQLGHQADLLDLLTDPLGGPYDGVWASAVLLHLRRDQLGRVLADCRAAVRPSGVLGFSVKEGDGEGWRTARLDAPRYFVYWRPQPLTELVRQAGWRLVDLSQAAGRYDDWLYLTCRAD